MPSNIPLMKKLGAYVMQAAETSPIVWKGRTLLMQTVSGNTPGVYDCCVCRTFGCVANASAPIGYADCSGCTNCSAERKSKFGSCIPQFFQLVDFETLEVLVSPIPGTEDFEMGSATVFGDRLWVYGTSGAHGSATQPNRIHCFSSREPTNRSTWLSTEVLQLPSTLKPFNTDVHHVVGADPAHPARQHIMIIETNGAGFPHPSWGSFFAETNASTPDRGWQLVAPATHYVSGSLMTACPAVRFFDGFYYVATTSTGMCPPAGWDNTTSALCVVVFRSRSLKSGEWVLGNGGRSIVFPGEDDRRVAPQWWKATAAERAAIHGHAPQAHGDINDSDFDFCDTTEGVLGIFAGIANQASNPYFNIAAIARNQTSAQWLASYFDPSVTHLKSDDEPRTMGPGSAPWQPDLVSALIGLLSVAVVAQGFVLHRLHARLEAGVTKEQHAPPAVNATAVSYTLPGSGVPRPLSSKLQEVVSVCDFGCTPNSQDDQSASLQKALDFAVQAGCRWSNTFGAPTGGIRLLFPGGVYRVTKGLTVVPPGPSSGPGYPLHVQISLEGSTGLATTILYDGAADGTALTLKNLQRFKISSIHLQGNPKHPQSTGLLLSSTSKGTGTGPGIVENCEVDGFGTGVAVGQSPGTEHLPAAPDHAASEIIFTHLSVANCGCGFHRESPDSLDLVLISLCAMGCPVAFRCSGDSYRNSSNMKVIGGAFSSNDVCFQLEVAGTHFIQGVYVEGTCVRFLQCGPAGSSDPDPKAGVEPMILDVSSCEIITPTSPQNTLIDLNCVGRYCFRSNLFQGGFVNLRGKPGGGHSTLSMTDGCLGGGTPGSPLIRRPCAPTDKTAAVWTTRLLNVGQNAVGLSPTIVSLLTRYGPDPTAPPVTLSACGGQSGEELTASSELQSFEMSDGSAALYLGRKDVAGSWRCVRDQSSGNLLFQVGSRGVLEAGGATMRWTTKLNVPAH